MIPRISHIAKLFAITHLFALYAAIAQQPHGSHARITNLVIAQESQSVTLHSLCDDMAMAMAWQCGMAMRRRCRGMTWRRRADGVAMVVPYVMTWLHPTPLITRAARLYEELRHGNGTAISLQYEEMWGDRVAIAWLSHGHHSCCTQVRVMRGVRGK